MVARWKRGSLHGRHWRYNRRKLCSLPPRPNLPQGHGSLQGSGFRVRELWIQGSGSMLYGPWSMV
jgi:hypothetical protein